LSFFLITKFPPVSVPQFYDSGTLCRFSENPCSSPPKAPFFLSFSSAIIPRPTLMTSGHFREGPFFNVQRSFLGSQLSPLLFSPPVPNPIWFFCFPFQPTLSPPLQTRRLVVFFPPSPLILSLLLREIPPPSSRFIRSDSVPMSPLGKIKSRLMSGPIPSRRSPFPKLPARSLLKR